MTITNKQNKCYSIIHATQDLAMKSELQNMELPQCRNSRDGEAILNYVLDD